MCVYWPSRLPFTGRKEMLNKSTHIAPPPCSPPLGRVIKFWPWAQAKQHHWGLDSSPCTTWPWGELSHFSKPQWLHPESGVIGSIQGVV